MVSAVLLCAGESRRMGSPKALLSFDGKTLLTRVLEQLQLAHLGEIICVTGSHSAEIENEIQHFPVKIAHNPKFATGMLSSVQCGIQAAVKSSDGVIITLVDLPYLKAFDFALLAEIGSHELARFRYRGQPAHPAYIPRKYFAEVLATPAQQDGCAFLFRKYVNEVCWIEADSPRGLLDVDTAEDFHAHLSS
ncbi:MAG: nucleotidyltransferase family protein [Bdellovibrionales bacterium]